MERSTCEVCGQPVRFCGGTTNYYKPGMPEQVKALVISARKALAEVEREERFSTSPPGHRRLSWELEAALSRVGGLYGETLP